MKSNLSVLFFKESAFCVLFKNSLSSTVVLNREPRCWSWENGDGFGCTTRARHVLDTPQCTGSLATKNDLAPDVNRLGWESWLSRRPEHILTVVSGSSQPWLQSVVLLACILVGMRRICLVHICAPFFY